MGYGKKGNLLDHFFRAHSAYGVFDYVLITVGIIIHILIFQNVIGNSSPTNRFISLIYICFHLLFYLSWFIYIHFKRVDRRRMTNYNKNFRNYEQKDIDPEVQINEDIQKTSNKNHQYIHRTKGIFTVSFCAIVQLLFLFISININDIRIETDPDIWTVQKLCSVVVVVLYFLMLIGLLGPYNIVILSNRKFIKYTKNH